MGHDLFTSSEVGKKYFDLANEIMEIDIQNIIFNGPEEKLKETQYTQPAIFVHSFIAATEFLNSHDCLLYTSPSPRDLSTSRMPSSA